MVVILNHVLNLSADSLPAVGRAGLFQYCFRILRRSLDCIEIPYHECFREALSK